MPEPATAAEQIGPEASVRQRYSAAAQAREEALCCPATYSREYLDAVPAEIVERDYGCGDPTPYVRPGDTVVDLGSGGGKACYILSQIVGAEGRVIGVDCNQDMILLARKYREQVAEKIGYANVEFRYGLIQDLALDLEQLALQAQGLAITDPQSWIKLRQLEQRLRSEQPMVADDSVDCVVSNCVLNLVRHEDRLQLFDEMFRVLRPGGRVAVSDIVSDERVPEHLRENPELWSGCVSGAFREDLFARCFEEAGFHGTQVAARQSEPWRTVEGIEFRSLTVVAYKGADEPSLERNQAVVYRGPFHCVEDDEFVYYRGERTAVSDQKFRLLQQEPYAEQFFFIEPRESVAPDGTAEFDRGRPRIRHPHETKGLGYDATSEADGDSSNRGCTDSGSCC